MTNGNTLSVFERLARTDTYASKRLKEKRKILKDSGRPFHNNIEIEPNSSPPNVSTLSAVPSTDNSSNGGGRRRSNGSKSTIPRASAVPSSKSFSSNRSSATSRSDRSVFDRLASTGTKSSLRKHKKSSTYDETKDNCFQGHDMLRGNGKGIGLLKLGPKVWY